MSILKKESVLNYLSASIDTRIESFGSPNWTNVVENDVRYFPVLEISDLSKLSKADVKIEDVRDIVTSKLECCKYLALNYNYVTLVEYLYFEKAIYTFIFKKTRKFDELERNTKVLVHNSPIEQYYSGYWL